MALSCLAGTNPLNSRTSCPVGGSAASGRAGGVIKQEAGVETMLEQQQQRQSNGIAGDANSISGQPSPGTPSPNNSDGPVRSSSALSAPSPVGGNNGANMSLPLFHQQQQQQQQQQQHQAALAAAGIFRAASLAQSYPGMVGQLPPHHLPSLMASLQAVAGVNPLHHHHHHRPGSHAGLGGLLPGLPFNFPSISHQHQSALLNWTKLAQNAAAAAALGVDGLGSILQQQHAQQLHLQQQQQQHQQQLSPDSSSNPSQQRRNSNNNNNRNRDHHIGTTSTAPTTTTSYTGGLIVSHHPNGGGSDPLVVKNNLSNNKGNNKTVKAAVARRNAKNSALLRQQQQHLDLMDSPESALNGNNLKASHDHLIMAEPPMVSPVGTTTSSSPPSINGSSVGSNSSASSASSGSKSRAGSAVVASTNVSVVGNGNGNDVSSRDKVFSCSICHRTFGYKHVLQNHERTHTGEKPFECKQCGKRFTRDHHLKTHMRLHTGEKPYNCTHCDRQFVQVANLRRHLRVHTGERPYACELCTSRFSDSNQLKAHMLIHKGEKPFQCQLCSGRFRRRHHLMHHKCPKDPGAHLTAAHHHVDALLSSHLTNGRGPTGVVVPANTNPLLLTTATANHKLTKIHNIVGGVDDDLESEPPPTPSSYASPPDEDDEDLDEEEDLVLPLMKQQQQQQQQVLKTDNHSSGRGRKARATRRVIRPTDFNASTASLVVARLATTGSHTVTTPPEPEQTEPEDLSTRIRHASTFSVGSTGGWSAAGSISIELNSDHDDDDDIDDDHLLHHDVDMDDDDDDLADLSDTADLIRHQRKKRRDALDLVHARKTQLAK